MFDGGLVSGVNFFRIVATAQQLAYVIIGQMVDHFQQLGILAEEVFARIAAGLDGIFLIFTVDGFLHALHQQTLIVRCQEGIPIGTPDHFDDVPARATKKRLELLNDLAVAAHRAVEPLQITVNYPNEIIEVFTRRERQCARSLRLIHFAVTGETPYPRLLAGEQAPTLEIANEASLVNR